MAAVLKKRALAEYSQTQVLGAEESAPQRPVKRLRLRLPGGRAASASADRSQLQQSGQADGYLLILQRAKTSRESLQAIGAISELGAQLVDEDVSDVLHRLLDVYGRERDAAVRACLLHLVSDLAVSCGNGSQAAATADELLPYLDQEPSQSALAQCLSSLTALGVAAGPNADARLSSRLVSAAGRLLSSASTASASAAGPSGSSSTAPQSSDRASHAVHIQCLRLIGQLTSIAADDDSSPSSQASASASLSSSAATASTAEVAQLVAASRAQDPRVRAAALEALLTLHRRGLQLPVPFYPPAVAALGDDFQRVREAALGVVHVLATTWPEHTVPAAAAEHSLRLADDAFSHICNAINDLSMHVRVRAASLLGSMHSVSPAFLEQTLDKKLISNMRRKQSGHERQRRLVTGGEWASGRRWADDTPRERVHADTVSVMASGACGAFIHGLEDEYLEVRTAALDSLTQLACRRPQFAELGLDFIVDMFNDEIEAVRLRAVDSLTRIGRMISLRQDQLDEILAVLEVFSVDTREGLHRMLGDCLLADTQSLRLCVEKLLKNLKRYPLDKRSVWRCFQRMGHSNADLVLPLVPTLLALHPYLDLPEPDVQDAAYIGVLLLVLNASVHCPAMEALFNDTVRRHFLYVRDTLPQLVPAQSTSSSAVVSSSQPSTPAAHTMQFLCTSMERAAAAVAAPPSDTSGTRMRSLLEQTRADLQRLARIDQQASAHAHFGSDLLEAQLLLIRMYSADDVTATGDVGGGRAVGASDDWAEWCVEALTTVLLRLRYQYTGLMDAQRLAVEQLGLRLTAVQLLRAIDPSSTASISAANQQLAERLVQQADRVQQLLPAADVDRLADAVLSCSDQRSAASVARQLSRQKLARSCTVRLPTAADGQLRRSSVVIYEPQTETEHPQRFTAGLVLGLALDAELHNLSDTSRVRIRVLYPDGRAHLILPRAAGFRRLDGQAPTTGDGYRLRATVLVCHQTWSEDGEVHVSVVLDASDETDQTAGGETAVLPLCEPVRVAVQPRAVRKGTI